MTMLWPLTSFLFILAVHYVADFIAQTKWMAHNKADSDFALTAHVATYMLILFIATAWWFESILIGVIYTVMNGAIHWMVDSITSKVTKLAKLEGRERLFFNVIGFDQLLHQVSLGGTLIMMIRVVP